MRPTVRLLIPLALMTMVLVGCGSESSSGHGDLGGEKFQNEQGKQSVTVEALDNNFEPPYVTVSKGTKITFVNKGHNKHNVLWVGDAFPASPLLNRSESVKETFDEAGDYAYYCSLHGTPTTGMTGGVRVVG